MPGRVCARTHPAPLLYVFFVFFSSLLVLLLTKNQTVIMCRKIFKIAKLPRLPRRPSVFHRQHRNDLTSASSPANGRGCTVITLKELNVLVERSHTKQPHPPPSLRRGMYCNFYCVLFGRARLRRGVEARGRDGSESNSLFLVTVCRRCHYTLEDLPTATTVATAPVVSYTVFFFFKEIFLLFNLLVVEMIEQPQIICTTAVRQDVSCYPVVFAGI